MSIFTKAREHFTGLRNTAHGPIEVAEWGTDGEPAKIYVKYLNLEEEAKRSACAKESSTFHEYAVLTLMLAAVDENLKPIFPEAVRQQLTHEIDPAVLVRVANEVTQILDRVSGALDDEKKA
mgnify:CR=1 FL=1